MELTLAIDLGTTNLKVGVVDAEGSILVSASEQLDIKRPVARAAEHCPIELTKTLLKLCQQVVEGYADRIVVVSISTYQFGLILLDREFIPLTGVTTLMDTRARVTYDDFKKYYDVHELYKSTACPPFSQYPLARLYYFSVTEQELLKKARYILSAKAFLLHYLCQELITEPSTEAASQMMNFKTLGWDTKILEKANLNIEQFPKIIDQPRTIFPLRPEIQQALKLKRKVGVLTGLYDGGALALGLGGLAEKRGVINIGTSGMLRVLTQQATLDDPKLMRLQSYYLMSGLYFVGSAVNNAALPLTWLKSNLLDGEYTDLLNAASSAPIGSKKVFFLPYFTGERDWEIGHIASACLFGLREFHTKAEVTRSALEGVAYCLGNIKKALDDCNLPIAEITVGGGGIKHPLWCEILCNVLNTPLVTADSEIACLVGNGILGQVAIKNYDSVAAASNCMVRFGNKFEPDQNKVKTYSKYSNFYFKLFNTLKGIYQEHALLER